MQVSEYDADDAAAVEAGRAIQDAHRAEARPWLPGLTTYRRTMQVRHSWDSSPERHFLARIDGRAVAVASIELGVWDNPDLAWIELVVDPGQSRRGHGSAFLHELLEIVRATGRSKVFASGVEVSGTQPFAVRHGFTLGQHEILRAVFPQELAPGLVGEAYAEARACAADYELIHLEGATPADLMPALSELTASINDAPNDDLDLDEEMFPVERIRAFERSSLESGYRLHRVIARHRRTGEPAGHSVVLVDADSPQAAHQDDTSVLRAHRGHRLGLLLKAAMMRRLAELEPQVVSIDTANAESNRHMIAVNERLGYRVMARQLDFQRRL